MIRNITYRLLKFEFLSSYTTENMNFDPFYQQLLEPPPRLRLQDCREGKVCEDTH